LGSIWQRSDGRFADGVIDAPQKRADTERLISGILAKTPDDATVYLAGSLTAGFGTPTSDVDVFVIRRGAPSGEPPLQLKTANTRVDIEFRSTEWLTEIVEHFKAFDLSSKDAALADPKRRLLEAAIRFYYSDMLRPGRDGADLRRRIGDAESSLRDHAVSISTLDVAAHWEDLVGFWAQGDDDGAAIVGLDAVICAASALLAARGTLYRGRRWVPAALRALDSSFESRLVLRTLDDVWSGHHRTRGLSSVQMTAALAQLAAWRGHGAYARAVAALCGVTHGAAGPRRGPLWSSLYFSDGAWLQMNERGAPASTVDLALFILASGSLTQEELACRAASVAGVSVSRSRAALAQLLEWGTIGNESWESWFGAGIDPRNVGIAAEVSLRKGAAAC
jgi:hypothetical protein